MAVCGEKGITRVCIPIWVAFNKAKNSPALSGAVVFHVFISHVLQICPQAMYQIIPCSVL